MRALAIGALLVVASSARAFVLGGGNADKDCRVGYGGVDATNGASGVICTDGDPTCDVDGVADGTCTFTVSLCIGIPEEGCDAVEIDSIDIAGVALARPPLPSDGPSCGAKSIVGVAVGTAQGTTAVASSAGELRDVDYLNLCCRTAAAPLDSARCAVAVEPAIAGCGRALPAIVARRFATARAALAHAVVNPERAHADVRRARRAMSHVRRTGQRLGRNNQCGDTLALIASHALDILDSGGVP
jgi:hypothetical protein